MSAKRNGERRTWLGEGAGILVAEQPYRCFGSPAGRSPAIPEAAAVAVPWQAGSASNPSPWDVLRQARRTVPDALLVLHVQGERPTPPEMIAVARRAAAVGARVTLVGEEPTVESVRDGLKASGVWAGDVARWLRVRFGALDPEERGVCNSVGRLVAGLHLSARERDALRHALRRLGLPTLHRWVMLSKILLPVVDLQTGAVSSVEEALARRPESGNRRTLDRRCVSLTGLTARQLGDFLGWEVVLERLIGRKSG